MDNKITLNNKEYDTRDFTGEQRRVLNLVLIANTDISKADARLQLLQAGREVALEHLTRSLESPEQPEAGEAHE